MSRPGWHADPDGSSQLRWWNGDRWDPAPGPHPDVRVGETAPDGTTWHWRAPPEWPEPPTTWYPSPGWEPHSSWPKPSSTWSWWTADAELDENATIEELFDDLGLPEAIERRTIRVQEQSESAWGEIDHSSIPLVWTPPPYWPPVPPGWSPPSGWKRPRSWRKEPSGWQFWQPDPAVVAERHRRSANDLDVRSRQLVGTRTGLEMELTLTERLAITSATTIRLAQSPLPTAARLGVALASDHSALVRLQKAHRAVLAITSDIRTYLLRIAYGVADIDSWFGIMRREAHLAWTEYKAAVQGVIDASSNAALRYGEQELEALRAMRPGWKKDERHAVLQADLERLRADLFARGRALESSSDDQKDSGLAERPGSSRAAWQAAEELAARALRGMGYMDARVTATGADGGIDVEGRGIVAQVKYLGTPVGRPDVQRLAGANVHGGQAAFFSRSGYAQTAVAFADQADVALFQVDLSRDSVTPVNQVAHQMYRGAGRS